MYRWVTRRCSSSATSCPGCSPASSPFTVTVTGLALSIGLLPAFLLGIPVLGADGLRRARPGRHGARAAPPLFLDVDAARPPAAPAPGRRLGAPHPACASRRAGVLEGGRVRRAAAAVRRRARQSLALAVLVGRRGRRCCCPLYVDAAARRRGRHLAALVGRARGRGRLRRRRAAAAARPGAHRRACRRARSAWRRRCCHRAAATRCAAQVTQLHRDPRPGRRRRRRRAPPDRARPARRRPAAPRRAGDEPRPGQGEDGHRPGGRPRAGHAGPPGGQGLHHRAAQRRPRRAPRRPHRPRASTPHCPRSPPARRSRCGSTSTSRDGPSPTVEAIAYFVVSEALTNVARHSGADPRRRPRRARRRPAARRPSPTTATAAPPTQPGSGLAGLRDRVRAVDGTFRLHSSPAGGTTVTVEVPCAS